MSIDAMKQALSAIEFADMYIKEIVTGSTNRIVAENLLRESGKSLRAAIEQAQEPVAWMYTCEGDTGLPVLVHTQKDWAKASWWKEIPLYTAPRQWQGLTQREIDQLWDLHHDDYGNALSATGYERAIEAKLKEKNT